MSTSTATRSTSMLLRLAAQLVDSLPGLTNCEVSVDTLGRIKVQTFGTDHDRVAQVDAVAAHLMLGKPGVLAVHEGRVHYGIEARALDVTWHVVAVLVEPAARLEVLS